MKWRYLAVAAVNHPSREGTLLAPKRFRFSLASAAHFIMYTTWSGISIDYLFLSLCQKSGFSTRLDTLSVSVQLHCFLSYINSIHFSIAIFFLSVKSCNLLASLCPCFDVSPSVFFGRLCVFYSFEIERNI